MKLPRRPFLGLVIWSGWRLPMLRPPRRRIVWIGHL